jgi:hypothetical protein
MIDALEHIEQDFEEYRRSVADCQAADPFRAELFRSAYAALSRLRERYRHERKRLAPMQMRALEKVFENDRFIRGMLHLRQVSEHVMRQVELMTTENMPLIVETSAHAMFAAPSVPLTDAQSGQPYLFHHLNYLLEAERRVKRALDKAYGQAPKK